MSGFSSFTNLLYAKCYHWENIVKDTKDLSMLHVPISFDQKFIYSFIYLFRFIHLLERVTERKSDRERVYTLHMCVCRYTIKIPY